MAELVLILSLTYVGTLFMLSRRQRPSALPAPAYLLKAFVIPCLNEERVIGGTLDSLVPLLEGDDLVLVVDDGSDDRTAEIVRAYPSPRVHLLERRLPNARQGKGRAL